MNKLYFGGDIQHQNIFYPSANKENDFGTDEREVYLVLAICLNVVWAIIISITAQKEKKHNYYAHNTYANTSFDVCH